MTHDVPKVLIVAYTFPPRGGSGVQRTVKFAKYLPEFGWQPVILTTSNLPQREVDQSLLEELPEVLPIYSAPDLDGQFLKRMIRRVFSRHTPGSVKVKSDSTTPALPAKNRIRRAWMDFVATWLLIPDSCIRWLMPALLTGFRISRQCDVIYSTSAPFTNHLVACFLHKFFAKPWIADFRDPWTQYKIYQHSSRWRSRIDAFLETQFLRMADIVTVTCPATAKSFQDTHPSLSEDKFVVITNGFDADDFDLLASSRFSTFTIAYTGRFDSQKNASVVFFQALKEIRCEHPDLAGEIKIVFAGSFEERSRALLKEWALEEMVEVLGYVSHQESVQLLLKSHVLLLTLSDESGVNLTYPGKLFEYLAAQKTILALVPEGATADLIRDMEAGLVVSPDNVEAIKEAVFALYRQYKSGDTLSRTYVNLDQFERRPLTERLAHCLEAVSRKGKLVHKLRPNS